MEIGFLIHSFDSATPMVINDSNTILEFKEMICNFLCYEFNNINLYLESYGQIDIEDIINLPLNILGLQDKNTYTYSIFLYDRLKLNEIHKYFCSNKLLGLNPIKQIGYRLYENNDRICLVCSIFCRKNQFNFDNKIINEEFICKCPLKNDNKCKFLNCDIFINNDINLHNNVIYNILKEHSNSLKIFQKNKKLEEKNKYLNRIFNFERSIKFGLERVNQYKNEELQKEILKIIPARENNISDEDYVKILLKWFKYKFYTWCDKPICPTCHNNKENIKSISTCEPNQEELKFLASRTELYKCTKCDCNVRFARYNNPIKLLETKTGRCGEWANLFGAILFAAGFKVRFVDNFEDHVWNEFYSKNQKRWIHVDSCENAFDKPLLYEQGWGRKMTFILGYSIEGVKDITSRYVKNWNIILERRSKREVDKLEELLEGINLSLIVNLSEEEQKNIEEMNKLEDLELENKKIDKNKTISEAELKERESGSVEWKKQRGEMK